MKSAWL